MKGSYYGILNLKRIVPNLHQWTRESNEDFEGLRTIYQEVVSQFSRYNGHAAKYVADGGQDLKSLFRALAQVEEFREMRPEDPNDQEFIVRSYLRATGFGDDGEIDEEISTWKDLGNGKTS